MQQSLENQGEVNLTERLGVEVVGSFDHIPTEVGEQGTVLLLRLESQLAGMMPCLTVGDIETAKRVLVGFMGMGVPSTFAGERIESYYLPGFAELARTSEDAGSTAIALLGNWPDYGRNILKADTIDPVHPNSYQEKTVAVMALAKYVLNTARQAERIDVFGQSTGGGVVLRCAKELLALDERLCVTAESPTSVTDTRSAAINAIMAKLGIMAPITKGITLSESFVRSTLTGQYGWCDDATVRGFMASNPYVLQRESVEEFIAGQTGADLEGVDANRLRVTTTEGDRKMIDLARLYALLDEHGIRHTHFAGLGHLAARQNHVEWAKALIYAEASDNVHKEKSA